MDSQENDIVIKFSDMWNVLVRRLWVILLVGVLTFAIIFASVSLTFVPRYDSVATLYLLQHNESKTATNYYNDFTLALKIVNDCTHIMKSHSVLDAVIEELDLDISYKALYNSIKITNPTDTRILQVTAESDSPQKAKKIVDKVCTIATEEIKEAMGYEQVYFYETGVLNELPCNEISTLIYMIVSVLAMGVTYLIFLFAFIFNDKISSDEDIKKHLGLSILGDIPNIDAVNKKKYSGKYYHNPYQKRTVEKRTNDE